MDSKIIGANQHGSDMTHSMLRRAKRHTNFMTDDFTLSCYRPAEFLETADDACRYIRDTEVCNYGVQVFNYLDFLICTMKISATWQGVLRAVLLVVGLAIIYCMFLYILCLYRILPNLLNIFNHVSMMPEDYGQLVSFCVVLPNIILRLSSCRETSENDALLMTDNIGKTCSSLFFGLIVMSSKGPVVVPSGFFLRSTIIGLVANIYIYRVISDDQLRTYVVKNQRHPLTIPSTVLATFFIVYVLVTVIMSCRAAAKLREQQKLLRTPSMTAAKALEMNTIPSDAYLPTNEPDKTFNAWLALAHTFNPFSEIKNWSQLANMICVPLWILAALLIPVIDSSVEMSGWSKINTCFSLLLFPSVLYIAGLHWYTITYVMGICILLVILIILLTDMQRVPKYNVWISCVGLLFGTTVYFIVASEIEVLIWQIINYMVDWRSDAISLIVFSFGYGFAQCTLGWGLIQKDNPQIAYGYVVGFTLSSTFSFLPMLLLEHCGQIQIVSRKPVPITAITMNAVIFLFIIYFLALFAISVMDFEIRYSFSWCILILYIIYLNYVDGAANDLIHSYGASHSVSNNSDEVNVEWS